MLLPGRAGWPQARSHHIRRISMTMGIVVVVSFTTRTMLLPPTAMSPPAADQLLGQGREVVLPSRSPPVLDGDVLASIQPKSCRPCRKAATRAALSADDSGGEEAERYPMRRRRPACCASAGSGAAEDAEGEEHDETDDADAHRHLLWQSLALAAFRRHPVAGGEGVSPDHRTQAVYYAYYSARPLEKKLR